MKNHLQIQAEQLEEENDGQRPGDMFGDILSSLDNESPTKTTCVLKDSSSVTPELDAGPQVLQDSKTFAVCALPADATDEAHAARMDSGRAQAAPPQTKP